MTKYPTKPEHHIDFKEHLERDELFDSSKLGPNP